MRFRALQLFWSSNRVCLLSAEIQRPQSIQVENRKEVSCISYPNNALRSFRNVVDLVRNRLQVIDKKIILSLFEHTIKYLVEYLVLKEL